ncbi:MAG: hypothetical protein KAV18_03205 [Candidatus Omnitrophica bacterium]|nr:hypothetical protein [Candidatus Omnitrophota bacterium]
MGNQKLNEDLILPEYTKEMSKAVSIFVRNNMEDFHYKYLSDKQMKELNPLIRNAICTALHAFNRMGRSKVAHDYIHSQIRMIPDYWEEPELMEGYKKSVIARSSKK